jgi:hypothetical protein
MRSISTISSSLARTKKLLRKLPPLALFTKEDPKLEKLLEKLLAKDECSILLCTKVPMATTEAGMVKDAMFEPLRLKRCNILLRGLPVDDFRLLCASRLFSIATLALRCLCTCCSSDLPLRFCEAGADSSSTFESSS